jgi:hypothetical protein
MSFLPYVAAEIARKDLSTAYILKQKRGILPGGSELQRNHITWMM